MWLICFCLAFEVLLAWSEKPREPAPKGPLVRVSSGVLEGEMHGDIAVFKGVPFARPPIGPLRWREPQPVTGWSGTRDATKPSHPCVQNVNGTDSFIQPLAAAYGVAYSIQPVEPSEDCLYLNVWTSQLHPGARLPVMVWLHGGSNRVGSGAEGGYDGASLASHGVIVVTTNYRLGAMGFFAHPELTAQSSHHSSGNYGLLDQIAALHWVQQNIAIFGGDPANVTLFGESAGSVDATTLMASPLSNGLFRRVIAESGPAFGIEREQTLDQMQRLGVAVGKEAGGRTGSQIEVLRKMSADQILEIENRLIASKFKGYDPNASVVDGWVLPQSPARAFALGAIQRVDLLAGMNAREFSAFRVAGAAAAKKSPQPVQKPGLGEQAAQFADAIRPLYGSWTDLAVLSYMSRMLVGGAAALDQATNDVLAACPIGAEAALTTNIGQRAFVYRFDRTLAGKGESTLGAFHSLEIPYVFGTFQTHTFGWLPFTSTDRKLSQTIQTYWTNFAKTGNPNGPGVPHWSPWSTGRESYIRFGQSADAVPDQHFSPIYCHLSPDRLKRQLANY